MKKVEVWKKQVKQISAIEGITLPKLTRKGYTDMYNQGMSPVQAVAYVRAREPAFQFKLRVQQGEIDSVIILAKNHAEFIYGKSKLAKAMKNKNVEEDKGYSIKLAKGLTLQIFYF